MTNRRYPLPSKTSLRWTACTSCLIIWQLFWVLGKLRLPRDFSHDPFVNEISARRDIGGDIGHFIKVILPHKLTGDDIIERGYPDSGGLFVYKNDTKQFDRRISDRDGEVFTTERIDMLERMDQIEEWDQARHWATVYDRDDPKPKCREVNWRNLLFPTCNTLHESTNTVLERKLLGSGATRIGWLVNQDGASAQNDPFVLKQISIQLDYSAYEKYMMKNQRETLILERLTASPRVVDLYAMCGSSSLVEAMVGGSIMNDAHIPDAPKKLRSVEKLDLAILTAEAIADMHGFDGGLIFNTDLSLVQFLKNKNGEVKLNDFNSGHIPEWDEVNQRYCKIEREKWNRRRYPPEVNKGDELDEGVDVFAYGDMLAFFWTGVSPKFGPSLRSDEKYSFIAHKTDLFYSTREDIITDSLERVMKACWREHPEDRPTIFEILSMLKKTKREYEEQTSLDRVKDKLWHYLISCFRYLGTTP